MIRLRKFLPWILLFAGFTAAAQARRIPKGKLFIIGGGDRPPSMMKTMLRAAAMAPHDYVIVLPMASQEPDTAYHYFKNDLAPYCDQPILNFNFTPGTEPDRSKLDSLVNAKLIFITGGDQDRFMQAVEHSPVSAAIQKAYASGALIAGTSAGAAVMSRYMITGRELTDTSYRPTFRKLEAGNLEIKPGLALVDNAIIDQHFVVRSRYNRLLSAIAQFPALACIGIDESTAIIVSGEHVKVVGESQVIVLRKPIGLSVKGKKIRLHDIEFGIYTDGDSFTLK